MNRCLRLSTVFLCNLALYVLYPSNADAAPTLRYQVQQRGSYVLLGNTLAHDCAPGAPAPIVGALTGASPCGSNVGDTGEDIFWRADSPADGSAEANTTISPADARSTAMLVLPAGASVTYARIYWSAERSAAGADLDATLSRPNTFSAPITADTSATSAIQGFSYQSTADVTAVVQANGTGAYRLSDVDAVVLAGRTDETSYAAWAMFVFYTVDTDPPRQLTLFDGLDTVEASNPQSATISGFVVPTVGYDAVLAVVSYEGDGAITGDSLSFNGTQLTNAQNPATNFFNGTRSTLGTAVSVTGDLPQYAGTAGSMHGIDLDVLDISGLLAPGQMSATIDATSTGDFYNLGALATAISTLQPLFTNTTKTFNDLDGGTVQPGDIIEYSITASNTGTDTSVNTVFTDVLPAGITYIAGSLEITAGANAGAKTDATGDDQGEYDAATRTIRVRMGSGADANNGGTVTTSDPATTIVFRVQVDIGTTGEIANQGVITGQGQTGAAQGVPPVSFSSSPSAQAFGEPTRFPITGCAMNADCSGSEPVCNTATGACVECTITDLSGCLAGEVCDALLCDEAPETILLTTPPETTNDNTPTFTFSSNDPANTFECSLDGAAFVPCDSPLTTATLLDGPHTLIVRARDGSGNVDPTPANYSFIVDTGLPDTTISSAPPPITDLRDAMFTFTSNEPDVVFECRLDGAATFTPCPASFTASNLPLGTHQLEVRAIDGAGNIDPTPAVHSWRVNDTPVAVADAPSTNEDVAVIVDVLANDTGLGDAPVAVTISTPPANGRATVLPDGTIEYTPDPGFFGPDSFEYTVTDADGQTATAVVTVNVSSVNIAPVANADTADTIIGAAIEIDVLANDTDADGQPLVISRVGDPANGTVTITANGTVIYTPDPGFSGTDTFDYEASDGRGGFSTATVTVIVQLDRDGDGAGDDEELAAGTDPLDRDTDDDGVDDGRELRELPGDFDGDRLIGALDPDSDNDGLLDGTELGIAAPDVDTEVARGFFVADRDPTTTTDPHAADTDLGTVNDGVEDANHDGFIDPNERNPNDPADDLPFTDDDRDGLSNDEELALGSDPQDADTDDDGAIDGAEVNLSIDSDFDGLLNVLDPDSDDDGLFDGTELGIVTPSDDTEVARGLFIPDADPTTSTSPVLADTDRGGVRDGAEDANHDGAIDPGELDPNNPADDVTIVDSDDDGLSDPEEMLLGTDPNDADSDEDGIADGAENNLSSDMDDDGLIDALDPDSDDDGLFDGTERGVVDPLEDTDEAAGFFIPDADPTATTSPVDPDTDDGTISDGVEDANRNGAIDFGERDPNDPTDDLTIPDSDGDTISDLDEGMADTDGDQTPNYLDLDSDDDKIADREEAGDLELSTPPVDTDNDMKPNYLDDDSDADGVFDIDEAGDGDLATVPIDTDGDENEDYIDVDADNDLVLDGDDNCRLVINAGQEDKDADGIGDACDTPVGEDTDGDGIENNADNCPQILNAAQENRDGDELGDVCDKDADGDGFEDDLFLAGGGCDCSTESARTPSAGSFALLALLAVSLLWRRRRTWPAVVLALSIATPARAEPSGYSIERFRLSLDREGLFDVEWGAVPKDRWIDVALWIGTTNDPLVLYRQTEAGTERAGSLVSQRIGAGLSAAVAFGERFQFGLEVPIILQQERSDMIVGLSQNLATLGSLGFGDLRLIPKLGLLRAERFGVDVAVLLRVGIPTSDGDYRGEDGVSVSPELAISRAFGAVRLATNLGFLARPRSEFLGLVADDEIFARIGAGYRFGERGGPPLELDATFYAATAASSPFSSANQSSAEVLGSAAYTISKAWVMFAGAGIGLTEGFGIPDWRLLIGIRLGDVRETPKLEPQPVMKVAVVEQPPPKKEEPKPEPVKEPDPPPPPPDPDRDGDSVVDRLDQCPDEAGDPTNEGCKKKQLAVVRQGKIEILEKVHFKTASATIDKVSFTLLDNVVEVLNRFPDIAKVRVEGHTDDVGSDVTNLSLSDRRAKAVRDYLVKKGILASRLEAAGYGETRPLVPNDNAENRSTNRRVEFQILENQAP